MKEKIRAFFADENKRKNFIFICATVVALALIIIIPSLFPKDTGENKEKQQYKSYSFEYFDTVSTVIGYAESGDEFEKISKDAFLLLDEYHKLFDIYNEYEGINNLCTVNKLYDGQHKAIKVDRKIIDMLLYAKEMYALTDGRVNVAMGSVLSIWHDYRTAGIDEPYKAELPPMDKLTEAAKHTNIDDLVIDEENCTVYLSDPLMKLDVGAIAKGYAVEMVARSLEEKKVSNFVLNIGGNIRAIGPKASGEAWKTGVENPTNTDEYIAYLKVTEESVVTSGSYQRYYVVGGKEYHHIINKDTLMPSEGLLSVTVICKNSALGDALSTALFCMSLEDGMALVNAMEGVEALWVTEDEVVHYSDNFDDYKY